MVCGPAGETQDTRHATNKTESGLPFFIPSLLPSTRSTRLGESERGRIYMRFQFCGCVPPMDPTPSLRCWKTNHFVPVHPTSVKRESTSLRVLNIANLLYHQTPTPTPRPPTSPQTLRGRGSGCCRLLSPTGTRASEPSVKLFLLFHMNTEERKRKKKGEGAHLR